MNAKQSAWIFAIGIICLGAVIFGFARGSAQVVPGLKAAWIGGSLVFAVLGVFLSTKIFKKK